MNLTKKFNEILGNIDFNNPNFDELAEFLFNKSKIVIDNISYNFAEIEIYFATINDKGEIDEPIRDIFCHCAHEQTKTCNLYFHYSGVDITIGNNICFGGILIRGVESNNIFMYGPGRVAYNWRSKTRRHINYNGNGSNNYKIVSQIHNFNNLNKKIIKFSRANLSLKKIKNNINNLENLKKFLSLKTRYIRLPDNLIFDQHKPAELNSILKSVLSPTVNKND